MQLVKYCNSLAEELAKKKDEISKVFSRCFYKQKCLKKVFLTNLNW